MTATVRTLSIEETLLDPPALPPPPTRHALLVILIALAALLHVVTVGTGDLYSETEGQYAGAAREMVASHNWLLPTNNGIPRLQKPPLLYWLIIASYKILGVNEAAARLPLALAVVATVALIFLIGEKLSDYWRGFIAGLIYLSFCGTFLLARIVMPEPLVTAFIAGAMFCGICGYERRRHRRMWFAGVWVFAALACLTKGVLGIVYPAVVFVLLSIFYREARIRFRTLLRWEYALIFLLILVPWHIWAKEKSKHIPTAEAREIVSSLRDKKSRAKQKPQRDKQCQTPLSLGMLTQRKSRHRRTTGADGASAHSRICRRTSRQP